MSVIRAMYQGYFSKIDAAYPGLDGAFCAAMDRILPSDDRLPQDPEFKNGDDNAGAVYRSLVSKQKDRVNQEVLGLRRQETEGAGYLNQYSRALLSQGDMIATVVGHTRERLAGPEPVFRESPDVYVFVARKMTVPLHEGGTSMSVKRALGAIHGFDTIIGHHEQQLVGYYKRNHVEHDMGKTRRYVGAIGYARTGNLSNREKDSYKTMKATVVQAVLRQDFEAAKEGLREIVSTFPSVANSAMAELTGLTPEALRELTEANHAQQRTAAMGRTAEQAARQAAQTSEVLNKKEIEAHKEWLETNKKRLTGRAFRVRKLDGVDSNGDEIIYFGEAADRETHGLFTPGLRAHVRGMGGEIGQSTVLTARVVRALMDAKVLTMVESSMDEGEKTIKPVYSHAPHTARWIETIQTLAKKDPERYRFASISREDLEVAVRERMAGVKKRQQRPPDITGRVEKGHGVR